MPFLFSTVGGVGQQITLVTNDQVPVSFVLQDATPAAIDAAAVTYTPADAAVWPVPPPANVAEALDLLGALRGTFLRNLLRVPAVGEAQTNVVGPFNVVPTKSGVYLAWASLELAASGTAAALAELTLNVDGAPQGAPLATGYTVGAWTSTMTQLSLVTVNRTLAHNWDLTVTTSDPLTTGHVDANAGKLLLLEL